MHSRIDVTGTPPGRRQILLLVTGLTPQVVTETIYALWKTEPTLIPTEVHLVTTVRAPSMRGSICSHRRLAG